MKKIKDTNYCLKNYRPDAKANGCFGVISGTGSFTENGVTKKIIGGYGCVPKLLENPNKVCPKGTVLNSPSWSGANKIEYECVGPNRFKGGCMKGYTLIKDYSQSVPKGQENCARFSITCQETYWKHPTTYPALSKTPCGISGAVMMGGKAGLAGGYCCGLIAK